MKRLSVILLCSVVFLCLVQVGAALTYEGTLEYSNDHNHAIDVIQPGDVITVSGIIRLPGSGTQTFDMDNTLEFYTQLEKAKWSIFIVKDGVDNPYLPYGTVKKSILGTDLAYPTDIDIKVKFSLTEGVVPSSFSGSIILVRALELDDRSEQVGPGVYKNGTVFSSAGLQPQLDAAKAKLAELKSGLDAKTGMGVDITAAQANYTAASNALNTATTKISTSPAEVSALLTIATNRINDANLDLDQAWAQQSLNVAKTMLASVDGLINEFTVNDSLKTTDSRLVAIINKRDLSAQAISNANDLFTTGSYPSARGRADEGLNLANQAWNLSLSLKTELGQGFSLPGLPNLGAFLPVLIVVVVVAIIAGVIIYRKKTQWDELG